jgi:hypothetical protein
MLSVSPGVEVDVAHFLEAEVGADGRGGCPVRLEDSGFQAHVAGIGQPFGHQRSIDPLATVGVERGRALHHRDGALGERKHARDSNRSLNTIKEGQIMSATCSERQHVGPDGGQLFREGIGGCVHAESIGKIKPLFTPSPPPAAPLPPCRPSALRLPGAARAGAARGRLLGLG